MKKTNQILLFALLFGMMLSIALPAWAVTDGAGSASDPLVSQSWVDAYVEEAFAPLEAEVAAIRTAVESQITVDIVLTIGSSTASVNEVATLIDADNSKVVPYVNSDSRTMVPVRFIAEKLGAVVSWNALSRTVSVSYGGDVIGMTIDSKNYTRNGIAKTMDTAPVIHSGWDRTMVPVRFVAEAFGCTVDWEPKNSKTTTVYISR